MGTRRDFFKTALAVPAALALAPYAKAKEPLPAAATPVPQRQLGKNGPKVSMIILGGDMTAHSAEYLEIGWSLGIRYFDTAAKYGNGKEESHIAAWLAKHPERRKELFLVSKDYPVKGPEQLLEMIDKRLAACGTDCTHKFKTTNGTGAWSSQAWWQRIPGAVQARQRH